MTRGTTERRAPRIERDLARAIARRASGRVAVVGPDLPALVERLGTEDQVGEIVRSDRTDERRAGGPPFDTVVILELLERGKGKTTLEGLRAAFDRLAPGGRLLVCAPNGACREPSAEGRPFTRASLKKLLKKLEQPKEFTDQPFRWLLMAVSREPGLDRPNAARCKAIARLCHGRVMELGCGPGHLSAAIAARGLAVRGVDMNEAKIARARRRYPGVEFRRADLLELPDAPTFDTVVLSEVLEHVPADVGDRMLDKAWSLVSPGGRLVVSVPNENCIRHPNHVREFTLETFANTIRRFGEPRVATHQPLKWLLAHVDRAAADTVDHHQENES